MQKLVLWSLVIAACHLEARNVENAKHVENERRLENERRVEHEELERRNDELTRKLVEEIARTDASGGPIGHLEKVEAGDETAVTAKRWVYASFFNRLRRKVATNWDPQTVWRRINPAGPQHGFKTRVTEVRVSLSPKGDLVKIAVTSPSGIIELDNEAVRAFHAAAPFSSPPDGLITDNLITFAFSFHFEIGAPSTSRRVLRQ